MKVYRLSRKKYPVELSGKGAAIVGGRWNPKGTELIYTAKSRALAMAEVAVHLSLATLPDDFVMLEIDIPPEVSRKELEMDALPRRWNSFPYDLKTQRFGEEFCRENFYCLLEVPSAVVPGDRNVLINPKHPDFFQIKIVNVSDFPFDRRIFF